MTTERKATFSNENFNVTISEAKDSLELTLEDRASGRAWGPAPLLALEIHDKPVRREDRLEKYRVDKVEAVEGGAHVIVGDTFRGVDIGLWLRLRGGELSVMLAMPEVYERKPEQFRLFAIDILPGLVNVGANGTLCTPISGGTICKPAGKPAVEDRFLIYMQQPRWELSTIVPVCGAWDDTGGIGILATQAAAETECRISTSGEDTGQIGMGFSLRKHWIDPVSYLTRELRFFPVAKDADGVMALAKRLRRHAIEDFGRGTIKQRAKESPELAYQLGCVTVKLFHGMEDEGACIYEPTDDPVTFINTMTFAEAADVLKKLKLGGIPRLFTQSVGWNARGHDGLYPTRFPVEERVGGEAGLREMIKTGIELGYQPNLHDNFRMNAQHAPDTDLDCVIWDVYGEPMIGGWWASGLHLDTWPLALSEERCEKYMQRVKDLGIQGMFYIDYMSAPLDVNYHPENGGPRSEHERGQIELLNKANKIFGSTSIEVGSMSIALACDVVSSAGPYGWWRDAKKRNWPIGELLDDDVPVWNLALQGLVIGQANGGPTWRNAMQAIAYGQHPRDEFSIRKIKMGGIHVFSERRIPAIKALHDLCIERFGHLQAEEIVKFETPADKVVHTTFADGTDVYADFDKMELSVNGENIPRPAELFERAHDV